MTDDKLEALSLKRKMELIQNWFNEEYEWRESKYRRLIAINRLDDDKVDPTKKLAELYVIAEEKRAEYNRLEHQLTGNGHAMHN